MNSADRQPNPVSQAERDRIADIADNAQLRSIENKKRNGWKLLPEDEAFLIDYESRQKQQGERATIAQALETEGWAIKSTTRWLENKPKIEALAAEYVRARDAVAGMEDENLVRKEWEKAEEMTRELNLTEAEAANAWGLAYGHLSLEELYPPKRLAEAQELLDSAKRRGLLGS